MPTYPDHWNTLSTAQDIPAALTTHFSYLADSPGFGPILEAIMKQAEGIQIQDNKLEIKFKEDLQLIAYPPLYDIPDSYPSSYQKILSAHELLYLNNHLTTLGEHGHYDDEEWHEAVRESELGDIASAEEIISPLWVYGDCWFFHPTEKNSFDQPQLYRLSHEGGDIFDPQPYNIGSLFLKRWSLALDLKLPMPSVHTGEDPVSWWNGLDDNWKLLVKDLLKIHDAKDAVKALSAKHLEIKEKYRINSLEPLQIMKSLTFLRCEAQDITDLAPLKHLKKLTALALFLKQSIDFSVLGSLTKLRELVLSDSPDSNIQFIAELRRLTSLTLNNLTLENIDVIRHCKRIVELELKGSTIKDPSAIGGLELLKELDMDGSHIQSFEFLKTLRNLNILRAGNTALNFLPFASDNIYILDCRFTPLTLEQILRFQTWRAKDTSHGNVVMTRCDYTESTADFIAGMNTIHDATGIVDALTYFVDLFLSRILLREVDKTKANQLLEIYFRLTDGNCKENLMEELASNALFGILRYQLKDEFTEKVLNLIPPAITDASLVYNLACYYAKCRNKEQLLIYTKFSVEHDFDIDSFRTDEDFINFHHDKEYLEFLELLPAIITIAE